MGWGAVELNCPFPITNSWEGGEVGQRLDVKSCANSRRGGVRQGLDIKIENLRNPKNEPPIYYVYLGAQLTGNIQIVLRQNIKIVIKQYIITN